jgi:hypothetical protein
VAIKLKELDLTKSNKQKTNNQKPRKNKNNRKKTIPSAHNKD